MSNDQTKQRIAIGWQCPECYGVNITTREDHTGHRIGWQCEDCGCNWSPPIKRTK